MRILDLKLQLVYIRDIHPIIVAITYKITLLGDAAVGKTSLRKKFMGQGFQQSYGMTIGADFAAYKVEDYTLHIWDLAGQVRFNSVIKSYYNGTNGSMIVFDLTRPESFLNLTQWIEALIKNMNNKIVPIALIGNKSDLRESSPNSVHPDDAKEFAEELSEWMKYKVPYVETSALTGENVDKAFIQLVHNIDEFTGIRSHS